MNLIKIKNRDGKQVVSARDVHKFLEVKTRFNDWVRRCIEKYDFTENADYSILSSVENHSTGATTKTDYIVTMDMAKELSMISDTLKGKEVRRYFIDCEKQLLKAPPMTLEEIMLENVKSMIEIKNKISVLEDKIDNKMGLTNSQAYQLQKKVNSKIINLFKTEFGKIAESEEEKVIYRKFFQEINKDLKSVYAVPSRNDIPQSKFEEAVEVVNSWYIPVKLKLEIKKFKEIKNV